MGKKILLGCGVLGFLGVLLLVILVAVSPSADDQPVASASKQPTALATAVADETEDATLPAAPKAEEPTSAPQATATETPTAAPTASGPRTSFGDGTWKVGVDIAPGTYRTTATSDCYWERLNDFGGSLSSIIANDNSVGTTIVTILPEDVGFACRRCGTWVLAETELPAQPMAEFSDGMWRVGIDIAPGTYRAANPADCYWERLSSFDGTFDGIITNANPTGPAVVTISPDDVGFACRRCGTWVPTEADQPAEPAKEFSDGTWRVGIDIAPGTYRAEGAEYCYWERLSDFSGSFSGIIANDNPEGAVIVAIDPGDAGFACVRCGNWVLEE